VTVIAVLISGFALGEKDPELVSRSLSRAIAFVAPQVRHLEEPAPGRPELRAPAPQSDREAVAADPALVAQINRLIASSRSGTAGALGIVALLAIVILLFTNVENTFNDIWGVRRGRSWLTRIVYYWTVITLGAVLFFTSFTLLSAGAFLNVFQEIVGRLPWGEQLNRAMHWMLPSASAFIVALVLTLFYRTIPNTRVRWFSAFLGAAVVTGLLFLNNYLAFLYFRNVVMTRSLYGSVALPIVLMAGLYVFWFIVLVGGQLTYAVQNVHYRSSRTAWHTLNAATRSSLSLLLLLLIARRFKDCLPPYSTGELSHRVRVPSQILNESLNQLCDFGLAAQLPSADSRDPADYRYQPARPLASITLAQFRRLFENYGEAPSGAMLDDVDPILAGYNVRMNALLNEAFGGQSLEQLIEQNAPPPAPRAP
jgi:membrane protein